MKKVERRELLDLGAYEEIRAHFRAAVIEEKMGRRFSISDELSMVFENHRTVLFQIQEMLRTERITKETSIQHEIDTYNELIPAQNELSGTVFVEIADREPRERRLVELAGLEQTFGLEIDTAETAAGSVPGSAEIFPARNETRGVFPDRTTAVHYLKFPLPPAAVARIVGANRSAPAPVRFRVRHPHLDIATPLPPAVLRAIAEDLADV
jgi:hypothetical protein